MIYIYVLRRYGLLYWRSTSAALFVTFILLSRFSLCAERVDLLTTAEPLVLTFVQNRIMLIDAVLGYLSTEGQLFLPLEEISTGLGLAITVDKIKRRAQGFYLSEKNKFYLDLQRGVVESAGQSFTIELESVIEADLDFYISLTSMNAWFNKLHFKFNKSFLFVEITSDPPLPIVQRRLRDASHSGIALNKGFLHQLDLPEVIASYEIFRPPLIDVSTKIFWSEREAFSTSTTFRGVQDLLKAGTNWFVSLDQEYRLRNARITFSRKDPDGGLLGLLHLTEIEAGDIGQRGTPLISRGIRGAGLRLTDRIKNMSNGTITELRGELPEGWEAELYQNDILSAFNAEPEAGQYVFADLPLLPGSNKFRIVLYGPQGQREEQWKTLRLKGNQPAPGKWYFDSSILKQDVKSLPIEDWLYGDKISRNSDNIDWGQFAAEARIIYGLSPGVSLMASSTTMSLEGQRRNFAGLSTEFSQFGVDINLDYAVDQAHQTATGARLATRIFDAGFFLQHETFDEGYRSPVNVSTRTIRHRNELRLNRKFNFAGLPINTVFRARYEDFVETQPDLNFNLDASFSLGSVRFNNQIEGSAKKNANRWALADGKGGLNISSRYGFGSLRAGLRYSIKPKWKLNSFLLSGSSSFYHNKAKLNATVNHDFERGTSFNLGLGWTFPQVELLSELNYSTTTNAIAVNIGLRYNLNWLGGGRLPRINHRAMTSRSFAQVDVFLDRDGDGVHSPGDELLPGVRFKPGRRQEQSDGDGRITVSGFSELVPTDVTLQEQSLPDLFLRSRVPGYRVTVRPGAPVQLSFPVVWVSDMEGLVLVTEEKKTEEGISLGSVIRGLGNVQILVLAEDGEEVRRVRSEYDGFFAVNGLPSGRYKLVIDPDQAKRFNLDDKGGIEFILQDDTAILSGIELHLMKDA